MKIASSSLVLFFSTILALTSPVFSEENGGGGDGGGQSNQISVCSDAVIVVSDVQLTCDSPGTYYYGSGKYRNSATCKPGDKANLVVDFYIDDPDTIQQHGGYALLSIQVDSYTYIGTKVVYENADLCSLSTVKSLSYGVACPAQGNYRVKTHFFWPESDYSTSSFTPNAVVGFKSHANSNKYDYGGANTDQCSGNSFVSWSDAIKTQYANAMSNFMRTFGILVLTVLGMGMAVWFLWRGPKRALNQIKRGRLFRRNNGMSAKMIDAENEADDIKKLGMIGKQDVLDF
jgi:cbb3-type cytochrome oxidase subunit 3